MNNSKPRFFVVIHALQNGLQHIISETEKVANAGADGIFIIPDYIKGEYRKANTNNILDYAKQIKNEFPQLLIGANFLTKESYILNRIYDAQLDLLQSDQGVIENLDKNLMTNTEIFYAVAFKYSKHVDLTGDLLKAHCLEVSCGCDVPTTSGNATGKSASIEKIKEIKSYLPESKRLGIASGVDDLNVKDYLAAGVTDFLVATSLISGMDNHFDLLDIEKVKRLNLIIKNF